MKELIGYIRVSTDDQGKSGNGLEAQQAAIEKFAADNNYKLIEVVTEVASGKLGLSERPVLNAAITKALKSKATVIVSKLDRLSRHAAFVLNLMDTKAKFIVAELGEAVDNFMLHIYAVVAQKEREMISSRTKAALQSLKAKGVVLGNRTNIADARQLAATANANKADEFAAKMRTSVERMLKVGMSLRAIAAEFNANGTKTARGGSWTSTTVANVVARFA
jgi:DNA invertase Pin-like site-specific DNA recombinase